MNASALLVYRDDASPWEKALYASLSEKHRRSGSLRTVQGCQSMLQHFFGSLTKAPDRAVGSIEGAGPERSPTSEEFPVRPPRTHEP